MQVPLPGFVNALAVAPSGRFVAAAVGQEHRLGRWFRDKEARNSLCIVPLPSALHRKPNQLAKLAARHKQAAAQASDAYGSQGSDEGESEGESDGQSDES